MRGGVFGGLLRSRLESVAAGVIPPAAGAAGCCALPPARSVRLAPAHGSPRPLCGSGRGVPRPSVAPPGAVGVEAGAWVGDALRGTGRGKRPLSALLGQTGLTAPKLAPLRGGIFPPRGGWTRRLRAAWVARSVKAPLFGVSFGYFSTRVEKHRPRHILANYFPLHSPMSNIRSNTPFVLFDSNPFHWALNRERSRGTQATHPPHGKILYFNKQ